jgi:hypothetical protein
MSGKSQHVQLLKPKIIPPRVFKGRQILGIILRMRPRFITATSTVEKLEEAVASQCV